MPIPKGNYVWSERAGRYRNQSTGRFVSGVEVRAAIDRAIEASAKRVNQLSISLKENRINLSEWQVKMMQELKAAHIANAAAARGGFAQLTQSDLGRIGAIIKEQLGYLGNFARQIESGEQKLDGRFLLRSQMYIEKGRSTYHAFERLEYLSRGFTQEKNIRHATDSCAGCIGESARGWVMIGELTPVGSRICLTRCKCSLQYQ